MKVSTATPAKINLWIEVLGKRPDGYHEISTLMLPLKDVCDRVDVELKEAGFTVRCDHPKVPADDENIALKAARAYFEAAGWTGGAHVRIAKNVPVAAGLGGGSSDAGAVLRLFPNRNSGHWPPGWARTSPFLSHPAPPWRLGSAKNCSRSKGSRNTRCCLSNRPYPFPPLGFTGE